MIRSELLPLHEVMQEEPNLFDFANFPLAILTVGFIMVFTFLIMQIIPDKLMLLVPGVLLVIFVPMFLIQASINAQEDLVERQAQAAVESIEQQVHVDDVLVVEHESERDVFRATFAFHQDDAPYIQELSMVYHDTYEMMIPVVLEDFDTIPVKAGSDLDDILHDAQSEPAVQE